MGRTVLAEDYVTAKRDAAELREEVDAALAGCDVLALPTLPILPPRLGTEHVRLEGQDVPVRALMLRLTQLFDVTGHPAVSLPCARAEAVLPVGLQLVGRLWGTTGLLESAVWCEEALR